MYMSGVHVIKLSNLMLTFYSFWYDTTDIFVGYKIISIWWFCNGFGLTNKLLILAVTMLLYYPFLSVTVQIFGSSTW